MPACLTSTTIRLVAGLPLRLSHVVWWLVTLVKIRRFPTYCIICTRFGLGLGGMPDNSGKDYASRHGHGVVALEVYSVEVTDSSHVVTLTPVDHRTRGGGVVVEVLKNGKAILREII